MSRDELQQRARKSAPVLVAMLLVALAYVWFASSGFSDSRRFFTEDGSYFAKLAEGFRTGHLYLVHTPDPRLVALRNPYDPAARQGIDYLWDASFYKGRYYLYFSPVPVVLFYLPYRLIVGHYPPDYLAAIVFGIWAFFATAFAVRRALMLRDRTYLPPSFWIVFIGFACLIPFQLPEIRIYEVSVLAGAAMTAMWTYTLVRMIESPSTSRVVWMSTWLALAIAARPNLGVLLLVAVIAIVMVVTERASLIRYARAALIPLAVVFVLLISYNVGRFRKPMEFGHTYQLTAISMKGKSVCRCSNVRELSRLGNSMVHYVFWPLSIRTTFPLLKVERADLDPAVSFPGDEEVIGVAAVLPLALVATVLAAILAFGRDWRSKETTLGVQLMLAAWLVIVGLSTCWFVVARYEVDFMLLLAAATVLCLESGFAFLQSAGVRILPLRIATAICACYSIAIGLLLGLVGREEAFRRFNPDLFYRLAHIFGMKGY